MSKSREKYKKDLDQQIFARLQSKLKPGRSRENDKRDGIDASFIYSYKTYHTYSDQCKYFCRWIKQIHPEAKSLKYARKYYKEYMEYLETKDYSASTLHTVNSALMKLFGIEKTDQDFYVAPIRRKEDFVRSRGIKSSDRHFSEDKNVELVNFCKGVGPRANVLMKLTKDDYFTRERIESEVKRIEALPEGERSEREVLILREGKTALEYKPFDMEKDFVFHYKDKHGKSRISPIIGLHKQEIIDRFLNTPTDKKVWEHVPKAMDVHSYRGDYATLYYKNLARKIEEIPYDSINKGTGRRYQSEVYSGRRGDKNRKLDRSALLVVSRALGHNRAEVVPKNYLKGI